MISLMLSGCIYTYSENYCVKYESFKITCNKNKLPEGSKCSDIISDQTIDAHSLNELQYQSCLIKKL